MKTEEQIKVEVTSQIVEGTKVQLNEEMTEIETHFEQLYRSKIDQDIKDALEIAETGCTSTTAKTKEGENKKFQQQLAEIRFEREAVEKKLRALDGFH